MSYVSVQKVWGFRACQISDLDWLGIFLVPKGVWLNISMVTVFRCKISSKLLIRLMFSLMQSIQILLYVYTCKLALQLLAETSYVNLDFIAFKEVYSHFQSVPTENICHGNEHKQAPRQSVWILCSGSFSCKYEIISKVFNYQRFSVEKKTQQTPVI